MGTVVNAGERVVVQIDQFTHTHLTRAEKPRGMDSLPGRRSFCGRPPFRTAHGRCKRRLPVYSIIHAPPVAVKCAFSRAEVSRVLHRKGAL